jgi:hypothetical protein
LEARIEPSEKCAMPRVPGIAPILACALAAFVPAAGGAVTLDGRLDPEYGAPRSVQTLQTEGRDNNAGFGGADSTGSSFGSELDLAYGVIAGGNLDLFFAGNLMSDFAEFQHQDQLHVFLDTRPGGQNVLSAANPDVGYFSGVGLAALGGLSFDPEFSADYWFDCTVAITAPRVYAYEVDLSTAGGGLLGRTDPGAPGTLAGGVNPDGVRLAVDNSNGAGVTTGCGAAAPGEVTRGIEWEIPLAAIGNPSGPIRVCAFVGGAFFNAYLSNQVLGPAPPGTCGLGNPATTHFETLAGAQWFTVGDGPVAAHPATWGLVKSLYR